MAAAKIRFSLFNTGCEKCWGIFPQAHSCAPRFPRHSSPTPSGERERERESERVSERVSEQRPPFMGAGNMGGGHDHEQCRGAFFRMCPLKGRISPIIRCRPGFSIAMLIHLSPQGARSAGVSGPSGDIRAIRKRRSRIFGGGVSRIVIIVENTLDYACKDGEILA